MKVAYESVGKRSRAKGVSGRGTYGVLAVIVFYAVVAVVYLPSWSWPPPPPLTPVPAGLTTLFKILQVADMHYTGNPNFACEDTPFSPCTEANMTQLLAHLLDEERPDLVVFTGDQIECRDVTQTAEGVRRAIDAYASLVIAREIPWAMVFGNHDEGASSSRMEMMAYIATLPYSRSRAGPVGVGGVGNYELSFPHPRSNATMLRAYFMDTGVDGRISRRQREYMVNLSAAHTDRAPALAFFHFPTPEYEPLPRERIVYGHKGEPVSHGPDSGLFATLVEMGDVKATFVGHDHRSDYCLRRGSIQMCYGGSIGLGYGYSTPRIARQARVILYGRSNTTEAITTYVRTAAGIGETYLLHQAPLDQDDKLVAAITGV
ncbi:hypothetical protein ACHHYP_06528 [Achlya hypogyna]|uniref:Calcineurin-like phosphoesterase domain-containing protein n=1 Tax=Achlya hypogyna TaxID=1202772 RepID=A0A1V9YTJ1_ACHHY|nr:hypothetical protein ACHHYP_06528 [Achlya hypogyna]